MVVHRSRGRRVVTVVDSGSGTLRWRAVELAAARRDTYTSAPSEAAGYVSATLKTLIVPFRACSPGRLDAAEPRNALEGDAQWKNVLVSCLRGGRVSTLP